jgi:glycosyltransferase involved in cell wall biosynthesis
VIADDGSTDDTPAVLERLTEDPRIRAVRVDAHGACRARNRALDEIDGDVVIYLDDDNRLDERWLASLVWCFGRRPDTTWLYGARVIDDLQRIETGVPGGFAEVEFEPFDRERLEHGSFIDTGVIAHRRDDALRFDPDVTYFGDWDLALRLSASAAPVELPAVAIYYATDQPDRLSGDRDPYYLDDARVEADLIRRRHATVRDVPAPGRSRDDDAAH